MKIYVNGNSDLIPLIKEALTETVAEYGEGGLTVDLAKTGEGLKIVSDGKTATLYYCDKTSLFRGIGILISSEGEKLDVSEKMRFGSLGNMVDCSRNAVITLETYKKIIKQSALMGHNCMMLYTEDTYEIESEPYFGHLRGRYSAAELKEMDAYAEKFGIELIPCIQTLAHLDAMFFWPAMEKYRDITNILNVAKEDTYTLIDKMLETMNSTLKSRRINIGMDEAHLLGRGKYLDTAGYHERSDIMRDHLKKVVELCKKWGYEPLMWDDMFFRVNSKSGGYYDGFVKEEQAREVPPEINLVYWDYCWTDKKIYTGMLEKHRVFKNNKVSFAGGAFTWYGGVVQTAFSMSASTAALQAMLEEKEVKIDVVLVTAWGDDGAETPVTTTLPTMILYGEGAWSGDLSLERVAKKIKIFGEELDGFIAMDDLNFTPDVEEFRGNDIRCVHKYLLHQDILLGIWDWHVPKNPAPHYVETTKKMKAFADKNTPLSYLYRTLEKLSSVLEIKADMGIRLKDAYDRKDKEEIGKIADEIPELLSRIREYGDAYRYQWRKVNRDFGLESFETRLGGLIYRLEGAKEILESYLNGERESIPQLEQERLPYFHNCKEPRTPMNGYNWAETYTACRR
ncbi:MAG: beta-N-acetylhexosaminidase [Clostridia bacterium]|nr:beta-N-acetylhexosaminidase [Clostridia bacterium]